MIKSINYSQEDIINEILTLHNNGELIDLDCTYSKGVFYKNGVVKQPIHKSDIEPLESDIKQSDSRFLPYADQSMKCIMFDPPFLATTGKSLKSDSGNIINRRFSVFPTEKALFEYYRETLIDLHRVLKPNGIVIFKCQDKVSSGKQYWSHVFIYNIAVGIGYYPKDLFVLLAKNRIVANWQKNQKHARKYHSYFWVLQKSNKKITY